MSTDGDTMDTLPEGLALDLPAIADRLGIPQRSAEATLKLLDEGDTVPFITRYRKEATGGLDEEQIRQLQQAVESRRQHLERAATILRLLGERDQLTAELRAAIVNASTLAELEDIYLPFRPKRRTRAQAARERGLGPLAEAIWRREVDSPAYPHRVADLVDPAKDLPDADSVEHGLSDILAEMFSEDRSVRQKCRRLARQTGTLVASRARSSKDSDAEGASEFKDYFDFSESIGSIKPHRVLALNRGEARKALRVRLDWDVPRAKIELSIAHKLGTHPQKELVDAALSDSLARLLMPSLASELRRELTADAEAHAISVFATNLRNRLMQRPLTGVTLLAIDPGYRTGCKLAVLGPRGELLEHGVMHILTAAARDQAVDTLQELCTKHSASRIAIGNGTGCREAEEVVSKLIADRLPEVSYVVVDEAGASIYSASPAARDEFPDLDATVRGTVSIGRRLLDPLSELVKIEPEHLGVGMYQHDLDAKALKASLSDVVESCVNRVGVDLNVASSSLLKHVAGLSQLTASRIVAHREDHGPFRTRQELLKVSGVGPATFTQAAGFLRISGGDEPLDATAIHPESYEAARNILSMLDADAAGLAGGDQSSDLANKIATLSPSSIAEELGTGVPTVSDILSEMQKPGRDPRTDLPPPVFRSGVLSIDDLSIGMRLRGSVQNVVDFGAFVDVGVKESGLIHVSQMSDGYVSDPHQHVAVGDTVTVWVTSVDATRGRIGLSLVEPE